MNHDIKRKETCDNYFLIIIQESKMIRKNEIRDKKLIWRWRESFIIRMPITSGSDTYFERTADEALRSDVYAEDILFECENEAAGYGLIAKTYSHGSGRNGLVD